MDLRLHLFVQKYSKNSNIITIEVFSIWIYIKMSFIPVRQSWIFAAIIPVFWSS